MNNSFSSRSILQILVLVLLPLILSDCKKVDPANTNPTENKQIEKIISASVGGVLRTSDSLTLSIPAYALPEDITVFLGRTGNEPSSVPNSNLRIAGKPVTIRIPSGLILKTIQLSFPKPFNLIDTANYSIFLFNGSTYFPVEYSISGDNVVVYIDKINWESNDKKGTTLLSEIIIIGLIIEQTPPASEMGLHKVTVIDNENFSFIEPTATSSSKVLLLIHGWTGNAKTWSVFLQNIIKETNLKYSEQWTFVYNSSWSVSKNAEKLADFLSTYSNGAQIDIVAHSMGGLVARSMIEQYNGNQYIHKLITLGTPHEGSSLALLRYLIGGMVAYNNPLEFPVYNFFTQGFRDLDVNSAFIKELNQSPGPHVPYYLIASTNDPNAAPRKYDGLEITYDLCHLGLMLPDLNDGIVTVKSAKGVANSIKPDNNINIPVLLAHLDMPVDDAVYQQVLMYLRDDKPTVETNLVTDMTSSTASVGGNVLSEGGSAVSETGVYWGTLQDPVLTGTKLPIGNGTGEFSATLSGLNQNTTYYVKAYAINIQGPSYGTQVSFTTSPGGQGNTVTDTEGNIYNTVTIGSQVWMAENLKTTKYNDGTAIPNKADGTEWSSLSTGAYGDYSDTPANSTTFGRLYNWYVVDNNASTKLASNGGKNVCPTGWHVPADAEWTILTDYLGGEEVAGGKLKETGLTHWASPNTGDANEYGFTALPGGYRYYDGAYGFIGYNGYWWSSTEYSSDYAWFRYISYSNANSYSSFSFKRSGFSVRCLRD